VLSTGEGSVRGCRNTFDHIVKTNKNSMSGLITKKYFSSLSPCKSRSAFPTYTHCHSSRTHTFPALNYCLTLVHGATPKKQFSCEIGAIAKRVCICARQCRFETAAQTIKWHRFNTAAHFRDNLPICARCEKQKQIYLPAQSRELPLSISQTSSAIAKLSLNFVFTRFPVQLHALEA
jgi:hypothetical protein